MFSSISNLMEAQKSKVAIVDLVGRGNGAMDYYDLGLQRGFEHIGADCRIYSNFNGSPNTYKQFVAERKGPYAKDPQLSVRIYNFTIQMQILRDTCSHTSLFSGDDPGSFPLYTCKITGITNQLSLSMILFQWQIMISMQYAV